MRPAHSPKGASSAERWMNCPGSSALLAALALPEGDDADFRIEGTAAHAVGARLLASGQDAWEVAGEKIIVDGHEVEIDSGMADAVQVYLNAVRPLGALGGIEHPVSGKFHKDAYGTVDNYSFKDGVLYPDGQTYNAVLCVDDYKHGIGIVVDCEWNPQIMYYAACLLEEWPAADKVRLRIIQPRAFHPDGPVREWLTDATTILKWRDECLIPAMLRAEMDNTLQAGEWCRFCPAKLVCPLLTHLFRAACTANPKEVVQLTNEQLGLNYQYIDAVKFYLKALEKETFGRSVKGQKVPGTKVVYQKANRVYKAGAEDFFKGKYGDDALTKPELKSPAQMEQLLGAKDLVHEWAYTPQGNLTIASEDDRRREAVIPKAEETFSHFAAPVPLDPQGPQMDIPPGLDRRVKTG